MRYPKSSQGSKRPIIRRLATSYSFVSYSQKDWPIVKILVDSLKNSGVWVDKKDVDLGDALPDKIESGISHASVFILVLSKASLESRCVKYESHMATIRHLEDSNFRILVLKIDDCQVPLRFRPFLYADLTKNPKALDELVKAASPLAAPPDLYKRHFVNRAEEIGKIELHVADPEKSIICLHGFYGIGKRTLAEESIRRIWQSPKIAAIELSSAHVGARLAAELSAIAGLPVPPNGAPIQDIRRSLLLAVETLVEQSRIIIFDHLEYLLDEEGRPQDEIAAVIDHIASLPPSLRIPCFLLSRRMLKFPTSTSLRVGYVKVGGMQAEHISTILESEASRIERKPIQDSSALRDVAKHLYGYPLAGRLAAPLIVKYSPEYLLKNLAHITKMRKDIADVILANTPFSPEQVRLLQVLSICDGALSVEDLANITQRAPGEVVSDVDVLADYNLLESEGVAVKLHPLVSDFYWIQARSGPEFKVLVTQIADYSRSMVTKQKADSPRFVSWLATACRTLFLSSRPEEAHALRSDFIGELKVAAIEMYQRGEYETSLRYCEEYLSYDSADFELGLHRVRNLSRLGRSADALHAIGPLFEVTTSPFRLAKLHFAQARTFLEMRNHDAARESFLKALQYRPEYLPALQGIAELLLKQDKIDDAAGFIGRALETSPMDSFALSMKADILWRRGQHGEAIETMTMVVKAQPENATFLFRLGRFYQQSGLTDLAYTYFSRAKMSDSSYLDARLSLASAAIDLGKFAEAKSEIEALRGRGPADKQHVLNGIEAQYYLAVGEIDKAADLADKALDHRRNVITLGMMAKVEAARARRCETEGMKVVADSHRKRAHQLLDEGLKLEPANAALLHQLERLVQEEGPN
jgi:tetratricopeptide (TPR) repeat protein